MCVRSGKPCHPACLQSWNRWIHLKVPLLIPPSTHLYLARSPLPARIHTQPPTCTSNSVFTRREASCSPSLPLWPHRLSISSMKMMEGPAARAMSNRQRTCLCVSTDVCVYVCVCVCLCVYVCEHEYMRLCVHVCMNACVYVCAFVCVSVCVLYWCLYVSVCASLCMCVCAGANRCKTRRMVAKAVPERVNT